ncbi:MAG: hypothetical protein CMJ58_09575 [Planctomycetaceae bacterium]|nr:hypothetical protein [Planctomycetaceae bacterium]
MMAAAALVAGVLVPTTSVLRDAMQKSREAVRRQFLANYAVRTLEDQASLTMRNWASASVGSSFAAEGHPNVKYLVVRSDDPAAGGLTDRLMNISVTVYDDDDGDSTADADELQVVFRTKVAKLATYENAPL